MNHPLDPKQQVAAQQAMVKLLSTPPEPILNLFERLKIPWQRADFDGDTYMLVKWSELMSGETRNQSEGPFIKKVVEAMKNEFASDPAAQIVNLPTPFPNSEVKKNSSE